MLKVHLDTWNSYPPEIKHHIHFILVDDGSRPILNLDGQNINDLELDVYRINEDLYWNTPGARNLALLVADTRIVFLSDMDCLVTNDTAQAMLEYAPTMEMNARYFLGKRKKDGTHMYFRERSALFMHKTAALKTGIFDEDFTGAWGFDDGFNTDRGEAGGIQVKYAYQDDPRLTVQKWFKEDIEDANHWDKHMAHTEATGGNNRYLYKAKQRGIIPPSNTFLRFSWQHMRQFRNSDIVKDIENAKQRVIDPSVL